MWNSFSKEFRLKINLIKENPLSFELKYNNIRIVFLKKFPYGIHYLYNAEENLLKYTLYSLLPEILKSGKTENKNPNLQLRFGFFYG